MSDVLLYHTADGGEVVIDAGRVSMDETPATAAYISLFGGNQRDGNITATDHLQWWGNRIESDETRKLRSETQHLLGTLPATTGNIARIRDAVLRDLDWMKAAVGAELAVDVTLPAINRIRIAADIKISGQTYSVAVVRDWPGT